MIPLSGVWEKITWCFPSPLRQARLLETVLGSVDHLHCVEQVHPSATKSMSVNSTYGVLTDVDGKRQISHRDTNRSH